MSGTARPPARDRRSPQRVGALLFALLFAFLSSRGALAQTRTWIQPAGGSWSSAANWLSSQVPDSSHEAAWLPDWAATCNIFLDQSYTLDHVTIDPAGPFLYLGGRNLWLLGVAGLTNGSRVIADGAASALAGQITNGAGGSLRVRGGSALTLSGPTIDNSGSI